MQANAYVTSKRHAPRNMMSTALGFALVTSSATAASRPEASPAPAIQPHTRDRDSKKDASKDSTTNLKGMQVEASTLSYKVDRVESPKYTQPLLDTPQTLVVIPAAVYRDQAATSLRDVLRNTPGITLHAGEGGSAPGDNLYIRGFSARNNVYIDGVRDPGVLSRDIFNVERVEVAKGPTSVVAGRGSTGGSINLVSKQAQDTDFDRARLTGGSARYGRGSFDLNHALAHDGMAFRLNGVWQNAGVVRRDDVRNRSWGIAPSLSFGLGSPTQVVFNYEHLKQDNIPDYGLPATLPTLAADAGVTVRDLDFGNFYGLLARDYERINSDVGTAIITHRFSDSAQIRNLTRYGRNRRHAAITPPRAASIDNAASDPGFDPDQAQLRRTDTKYQDRQDRIFANQTDLNIELGTGAVRHRLDAGLELAREKQNNYGETDTFANGRPPVTDLFDPDPRIPYIPDIRRTGAHTDASSGAIAAYAFDTVELGTQWQLSAGLRRERFHVEVSSVDLDDAGQPQAPQEFQRTDNLTNWRAGAVYKPATNGSLYAAFSTSFDPSADGSFGLDLSTEGGRRGPSQNDPRFGPEKSHNAEIGTKWNLLQERLTLTAALFRTEKTNAKTTNDAGNLALAGDQRVQGIEVDVSGNLTDAWSVFVGYAYMDGKIEQSGDPAEIDRQLQYLPKQSFNLWTSYQLPTGLLLGIGAQFTDGYFFDNTNDVSSRNDAAIQSLTRYWLYSAMVGYQFNEHFGLQLNMINLSNERYVDRGYGGHFIPGPGRTALLSADFSF